MPSRLVLRLEHRQQEVAGVDSVRLGISSGAIHAELGLSVRPAQQFLETVLDTLPNHATQNVGVDQTQLNEGFPERRFVSECRLRDAAQLDGGKATRSGEHG